MLTIPPTTELRIANMAQHSSPDTRLAAALAKLAVAREQALQEYRFAAARAGAQVLHTDSVSVTKDAEIGSLVYVNECTLISTGLLVSYSARTSATQRRAKGERWVDAYGEFRYAHLGAWRYLGKIGGIEMLVEHIDAGA